MAPPEALIRDPCPCGLPLILILAHIYNDFILAMVKTPYRNYVGICDIISKGLLDLS